MISGSCTQVSMGLPDPRDKSSLPMLKRFQALIADSTMVRIHLRRSKFDQFGAGANIILGHTGHSLCPVTTIIDYIAICGSGPGLFSQLPRAQAVIKAWFVDQLRATLSAMGLPKHLYAGHSFHIGAATTAAMARVEDADSGSWPLAECCLRAV